MNELRKYIESNKVIKTRIDAEVRDANMNAYPKRNIFVKLQQYSNDFMVKKREPRLIGISGLRGVGKTTVMWQTTQVVYKKYTKDIYSLNGNVIKSLGFQLLDVIQVFEKYIIKKTFV